MRFPIGFVTVAHIRGPLLQMACFGLRVHTLNLEGLVPSVVARFDADWRFTPVVAHPLDVSTELFVHSRLPFLSKFQYRCIFVNFESEQFAGAMRHPYHCDDADSVAAVVSGKA